MEFFFTGFFIGGLVVFMIMSLIMTYHKTQKGNPKMCCYCGTVFLWVKECKCPQCSWSYPEEETNDRTT